jgi:hypothetical protein
MVEKVQASCERLPEKVSADASYCNTKQLTEVRRSGVDLYVSLDQQKHGSGLRRSAVATTPQAGGGVVGQMREKLKTAAGQALYQWRKATVEPVSGQIDEGGFRRFAFRGLAKVSAEWALVCLNHNALKLWRAKLHLFTGQCDTSEPFASHRTPDLSYCQRLLPRTEPTVRQRSSPLPNLAPYSTLLNRDSDRLLANSSIETGS